MTKQVLIPVVLAFLLTFALHTTALAYSGIVAFGDSLSDNGPADGHGLRISSNGRVWVDYLAERLGVGLLDLAYSSAHTDYHPLTDSARWGFCWQVNEYLNTTGAASGDKLYIIWIGGNDLLKGIGAPRPIIDNAVMNITYGLERLIGAGARHFLVMNLPNLGLTPLMNGQNLHMNGPDGPHRFVDNPDGGTRMAAHFNTALDRALTPYRDAVNLFEIDVFALTNRFVAEGVFDNSTHMLMAHQPTCQSFMFWDTHHPTDDAHRLIALAAYQAVAVESEPAARRPTDTGRIAFGRAWDQVPICRDLPIQPSLR